MIRRFTCKPNPETDPTDRGEYRSQKPRKSLCFVLGLLGSGGSVLEAFRLPCYIFPRVREPLLSFLDDFRADDGLPFAALAHPLDAREDAGER